jgi:hypothetical protein
MQAANGTKARKPTGIINPSLHASLVQYVCVFLSVCVKCLLTFV